MSKTKEHKGTSEKLPNARKRAVGEGAVYLIRRGGNSEDDAAEGSFSEVPKIIIPKDVTICAVTKGHSVEEVKTVLAKYPQIKIIAENRWPDCEEKFKYFTKLEKHFIGPLQSNKVRKVIPFVDVIQSVDSLSLLTKINSTAADFEKTIKFCIQINVSHDPNKSGIKEDALNSFIEEYLHSNFNNIELVGLMTIGGQSNLIERTKYFASLKKLFDFLNKKYFPNKPLKVLSMGMSEDYQIAIKNGATMVRLGTILFSS